MVFHKVLNTRFPNQIIELSYSGDSESTEVSWKVDFTGKGVGNLFFPFFNAYLGSDIKKSLKNLKKIIEG